MRLYTISATPLWPNGTESFRREIGAGIALGDAMRVAAEWGDEWKPEDAAEKCSNCGGSECDFCEDGRWEPDALDLTISWREADAAELDAFARERKRILTIKIGERGYSAVAADLEDGTLPSVVLDRVVETMGEDEQDQLLPLVREMAELPIMLTEADTWKCPDCDTNQSGDLCKRCGWAP